MISYLDVVAIFPEFKTSDPVYVGRINAFIQQAIATLDPGFFGSMYSTALVYKVADLISRSNFAMMSGGMASGRLSGRTVNNEYSVSYAVPRSSAAATTKQAKSDYGALLDELVADLGAFPTTLDCGCSTYAAQAYTPICYQQNVDQDLVIKQGATFERLITLSQDCTPINLTGYTASAQIRESYNSPSVLATFTVEFTDRLNGQIKLILTSDITNTLPANLIRADKVSFDVSDLSAPPYVWDIELIDPIDRVIRPLNGRVLVSPQVSL